jgi:hypothetical protein
LVRRRRFVIFNFVPQPSATVLTLPFKAKENADDLLKEKVALENKKRAQEELAAEKLKALYAKVKTIVR